MLQPVNFGEGQAIRAGWPDSRRALTDHMMSAGGQQQLIASSNLATLGVSGNPFETISGVGT